MSDSNALVTRDVRRESRYPVPSRPYPTQPALYRTWGDSHHIVTYLPASASAAAPDDPLDDMVNESPWTIDTHPPLCETTEVDGHCDRRADLVISSHLTPRFLLCVECWVAEAVVSCRCPATGRVEGRDAHYRIVEGL